MNKKEFLKSAIEKAEWTKTVVIQYNALENISEFFKALFDKTHPLIFADPNTFEVAGKKVWDNLKKNGLNPYEPFVLDDPQPYADYEKVDLFSNKIKSFECIPIAVGSGTINDLVKLSSWLNKKKYMVVATAASMDGYTAYGASIAKDGFKQTFFCPAPTAIIADTKILSEAPPYLNAAGYGDLVAKTTAGSDWIIADDLGIEHIDKVAWDYAQKYLKSWIQNPEGIQKGDLESIENLIFGLVMTGLAMQKVHSSRPASGAEHQFSHLWDIEGHTYKGHHPFHGYKVGIGTIASASFHSIIVDLDINYIKHKAEKNIETWAPFYEIEKEIFNLFPDTKIRERVIEETKAKYPDKEKLAERLRILLKRWDTLKNKLKERAVSPKDIKQMLKRAGAAHSPSQIGIPMDRMVKTCRKAYFIRRRYTILDFITEFGMWDDVIQKTFEEKELWQDE